MNTELQKEQERVNVVLDLVNDKIDKLTDETTQRKNEVINVRS
jgi:DNA helicase-2/ATP-dependent DNA helicase PcrA